MHRMGPRRAFSVLWSKSAIVIGFGFLALFVQAAQAQGPLNYFKNYFVTGDYVVGGVGLAGTTVTPLAGSTPSSISVSSSITLNSVPCTSGPGPFAGIVPCTANGAVPADVIAAFLYWQTNETSSTPSSAYGSFDAAFPANPFVGLALGNPTIAACAATGGGTGNEYLHNYRADVLKYLPINNTANVRLANGTQTFTLVSASTGTQFVGATLVVVYRLIVPGNPRIAPLRSVVIYDGAFTGTASAGLNQAYIGGIYQAATAPAAHMTQVVGNGQKGFTETLTVNGAIPAGVPSDPFVGAQGKNWDNYTYNINLAANASSVNNTLVSSRDCLSWAAIIASTNVQDSDFDGLLDIWETSGLSLNPGVRNDGTAMPPVPATFGTCAAPNASTCLNLPAMGASPYVPDIFMQIDWMQGTYNAPHVHNPQLAALNMVGAAFKAHGINLHFDVGGSSTYQTKQASAYIIPATLAQGGNVVEETGNLLCPNSVTSNQGVACAFPSQSNEYSVLGWKSGFDAIKNGDSVLGLPQLFATDRKDVFHYALFGHAIAATTPLSAPLAGSISGVGDLPGGDLMVTLGLWRSDNPTIDQIGSELEQAGTLMHELGHNLDLKHGGWNNTPVCMPNYPSVMNYLYQVNGLTDSSGNEHIDYSYGLDLPMSEDFLSSLIPMGIQNYAVRYFGPLNPATNTASQASLVDCNGQILSQSLSGEGPYVSLQGASVSTPDWSNGTVRPLGSLITKGLDINYDGIMGETFLDSPDWLSLNLQQVGARPNANGLSLNVGISDIGISDIGISDIGISDIGISDIGISDIGISDIGISDIGTAQLGQDALGDQDYASLVLSGGTPISGLTAVPTTTPPSTAGTGNLLSWTPPSAGQVTQYNIYRCNASGGACTPAPPAIASVPGGTTTPTFTDAVNNFVAAGTTCPPAPATCYNTNYAYYVTAVVTVGSLTHEGGPSNTASSEVNHLFVIANNQTVAYLSPDPTPTYTLYGNGATSLSGVTCVYTPATPKNGGTYPITCSGPASTGTAGIVGVTYNAPYLSYIPGILTITPRTITVTAAASSKTYNGTTSSPATPTITSGSLAPGDTITWTETYDNRNVGTNHVMTPMGTATGTTSLSSYTIHYVTINTGIIIKAAMTVAATTNTKTYDGTTSAAAIPATPGLQPGDTVTSSETYNTSNVGTGLTLTVSPGYTVNDGNGGNNYTVTTATNSTGVINAAPLTGTIQNTSRVYGAPNPAFSVVYGGFVDGQTAAIVSGTLTCSTSAVASSPASPPTYPINCSGQSAPNYALTYVGSLTITPASTTTAISLVSPLPATSGQPVTVTVTVAPQFAGTPTGSVTVNSAPAGTSCAITPFSGSGSCVLTFAASGPESLTATYNSGSSNFSGSSTSAATPLTVNPPAPTLTSITVTPAPHTSYTGDTVFANYDWPGQGTVLASGGSGPVTSGTPFNATPNGINVAVSGASIVVTLANPFSFDTTPVSFDGLVITDPLATITGVSLASTNISGYTGSASQLYFDGNDVYINFPHPAFASLPAGATLTVNVTFSAAAPAAPYSLPGGSAEQFTAIGNYSSGPSQNLTGLVTWAVPSGTAAITSGGIVTGGSDGSSTITATLGGVQGSATVTVPSLVSIAVAPSFPSIAGVNAQQFTATGTYSDSSTQNLTGLVAWASSATGVASITAAGLATGVTPGSTAISAALGGVTGTMLLTVNAAALSVTPGTFPNGQFLAPYAPQQIPLTINGGVAPYTLSLANNGVVPIGMTLASGTSAAAALSGTPAQAGMWSVPVVVTDSTTPTPLTQTVNVPLTIGLATGYAGGSNCYMPYPTTPMYYLGNGTAGPWSVTAPGAFSGQLTFLSPGTVTIAGMVSTNGTIVTWYNNQGGQNDQFVTSSIPSSIVINNVTYSVASVNSATSLTLTTYAGVQTDVPYSYTLAAGGNYLTGCLTGGSSGSYQLQLTSGSSAFTLPLQLVAQDTQDNGTVQVNSGGVGDDVPPSSVQQGVVTSGQSFMFLPPEYLADSGFSGNVLFGFTGAAPQLCGTGNFPNTSSLTASQAGRYDIAIDGTTQGCSTNPAFPASPAPTVFESVDALNSPAVWASVTVSGVVVSSGNSNAYAVASNVLEIEAGGTSPNPVTIAFNYVIDNTGCPGCIDQLQVGLNSDVSPQTSAYNGGSFGSGSASVTINVPNTPGRYYIAIDTSEDYGFLYSSPYWANGQPGPTQYIGVVDVW
jgi:hypothetical protein